MAHPSTRAAELKAAECSLSGERNYVQIQAGRKVVPTELGITLVRGYQLIDSELCSPQVIPTYHAKRALIMPIIAPQLLEFLHGIKTFRTSQRNEWELKYEKPLANPSS